MPERESMAMPELESMAMPEVWAMATMARPEPEPETGQVALTVGLRLAPSARAAGRAYHARLHHLPKVERCSACSLVLRPLHARS